MMKTLPLALAIVLAGHAALAAEDAVTSATAHAAQSASVTVSGSEIVGGSSGANGITESFNTAAGPINILQNSGDNVAQSAQNALARAVACPCGGPVLAEATGTQVARVSMDNARIERSGGSNTITGSFAGASGMINVMQNTGSNVVQSAQNSLAMVVRRP